MRDRNREKRRRLNSLKAEDDKNFENVTKLEKKHGAKLSKRFAIFTCIFAFGIAVALNWDTLSPQALLGTFQNFLAGLTTGNFPVTYSQGTFVDAVPMGQNFGVLTDSAFIIYSANGGELVIRQHGMSSPCVSACGSKAVIYESGGTHLKVESRYSELYNGTTTYDIITAAVNAAGYLSVITGSSDYLSEMTVYNSNYKQIFKWYSSKGRILSVAINKSGTRAAALTVAAKDGDILSTLYVYDLSKTDPVATVEFPGVFLFSVQYNDNGTIAAVGETETCFFNASGVQTASYSYTDKTLKCYSNTTDGVALVFSRYGVGEESTVVSLGTDGKASGTANIGIGVKSISTSGSNIAALCSNALLYYKSNFTSSGSYEITGDVQKLLCIKNNAYIFGSSAVYQYKIN